MGKSSGLKLVCSWDNVLVNKDDFNRSIRNKLKKLLSIRGLPPSKVGTSISGITALYKEELTDEQKQIHYEVLKAFNGVVEKPNGVVDHLEEEVESPSPRVVKIPKKVNVVEVESTLEDANVEEANDKRPDIGVNSDPAESKRSDNLAVPELNVEVEPDLEPEQEETQEPTIQFDSSNLNYISLEDLNAAPIEETKIDLEENDNTLMKALYSGGVVLVSSLLLKKIWS
jgi:hypothetical protein